MDEIKSVPYVPTSHPFVERLIGTVRREYFDQVLSWNSSDLKRKLAAFQGYYNLHRVHRSLDGVTPAQRGGGAGPVLVNASNNRAAAICRNFDMAGILPEFRVTVCAWAYPNLSFAGAMITRI